MLSAERRAIIDRESEREAERDRKAAELAAQQADGRPHRAIFELRRQGVEPRTVGEALARIVCAGPGGRHRTPP
jgi:hypothetical protein